MNNLGNIKEILTIPSGSRNDALESNSMLTDSQFSFGSQFWPESSLDASQELSSPRNSQLSSQEESDPTILGIYQNKPPLFGDKAECIGIFEEFEEERENAKEKSECGVFVKEGHLMKATLSRIQTLTADTERNSNVCQSILEKLDKFSDTLLNIMNSFQSATSQQFDTLVTKVNSQKGIISELEDRVTKSGSLTAELDTQIKSLKKSLEGLKEEQETERQMLEEALKNLSTLLSVYLVKPNMQRVVDKTSQTSPDVQVPVLNVIQENNQKVTQRGPKQGEVLGGEQTQSIQRKTKWIQKRQKKCPMVQSQRSECTDENSSPFNCRKQKMSRKRGKDSVRPRNWGCKASEDGGCFISPLSFFTQQSNSPEGLTDVSPFIKELSSNARQGTAVTPLSLWKLFDWRDEPK